MAGRDGEATSSGQTAMRCCRPVMPGRWRRRRAVLWRTGGHGHCPIGSRGLPGRCRRPCPGDPGAHRHRGAVSTRRPDAAEGRKTAAAAQPAAALRQAAAAQEIEIVRAAPRVAATGIAARVGPAAAIAARGIGLIPGALVDEPLIGRRRRAGVPGALIDRALARRAHRRPPRARAHHRTRPAEAAAITGMRREQPHQRIADHHAAGHAGRRGQRRAEEARPAALEHARLVARGVLRRRRGILRRRRVLRLRRSVVPHRARLRRRGGALPAAEQAAEEAATLLRLLGRLLGRLLRLLQRRFHLLEAVLRLGQRVLLHEGELGQAVARFRVAVEHLADQRVRLAIDRRQRLWRRGRDRAAPWAGRRLRAAADAADEVRDDVAFFVGHAVPPLRGLRCWPGSAADVAWTAPRFNGLAPGGAPRSPGSGP